MGAIKTLADKIWKAGPPPSNERIRQVTDEIDELVGDGTLEAARSTGNVFEGPIDFDEIDEPDSPAADRPVELILDTGPSAAAAPQFRTIPIAPTSTTRPAAEANWGTDLVL